MSSASNRSCSSGTVARHRTSSWNSSLSAKPVLSSSPPPSESLSSTGCCRLKSGEASGLESTWWMSTSRAIQMARYGDDRWEVQVLGALPCFSCSTYSYVYHFCLFFSPFQLFYSFIFTFSIFLHFSQMFHPFFFLFFFVFISSSFSLPCPPFTLLHPFSPTFSPLPLPLLPSFSLSSPSSPLFPHFLPSSLVHYFPFFSFFSFSHFPILPFYLFYTFNMTSLLKIIPHTLKQDAVGRETDSRMFIQCGS